MVTEKANEWLSPAYDEETRKEVQAMLDNEDKTPLSMLSIANWNLVPVACAVLWVQAATV